MTKFVQFHVLTAYPAANPNRDDQGRPKTVWMHDALRLRISSQALKRALRESSAFKTTLKGHLGQRTKRMGLELEKLALDLGADEDQALEVATQVASVWGKIAAPEEGKRQEPIVSALAFISPDEEAAMREWVKKAIAGENLPSRSKLADSILNTVDGAVDIAMFGRFLAGEKRDSDNDRLNILKFGRDGAVQVSHPFTTHAARVEDDYYTAVDDMRDTNESQGAAMTGDMQFGSGVYYTYACVNVDQLISNLNGDEELAAKGLEALTEALATASPSGKMNSFAHHPRAAFMRVTVGEQQPCNMAQAFSSPVQGEILKNSIRNFDKMYASMSSVYGDMCDDMKDIDILKAPSTSSLQDLKAFSAGAATMTKEMVDG
ncbi:type I-E CRISPR-associated protein Cas7/Cse4/CasC [Candidatus Poribacteria bacterium]|nr:type I-E CRISPR-associated protein Cas7/Cse4/CasC [Candidatus Poribacteria bacterium]